MWVQEELETVDVVLFVFSVGSVELVGLQFCCISVRVMVDLE